jgi:aspartyl-tRNA(Asn)/glutamyl-tRNA(Gln) amidotransferase subunit A
VDALAGRIERVEPVVGAFTTLALERARAEAGEAEHAYLRGEATRSLEGVPFAVKDLFDTAWCADDLRLADLRRPRPGRRAREAGAILLGKTSTHEFAWGITSVNRRQGTPRNPWALERMSGGSSGGSAVALAALEAPLALGSDTGGSIRVPSAFCGVVGLKPTYGRISAAGVFPLARSLDHPGPMARTPADAALLLAAIVGLDPADPATEDVPLGDLDRELEAGLARRRVAVCPALHRVALAPDLQAVFDGAVDTVEQLGAELVEADLPEAERIYETFGVIQRSEALLARAGRPLPRAAGGVRRGRARPPRGRNQGAARRLPGGGRRAAADPRRLREAFPRR